MHPTHPTSQKLTFQTRFCTSTLLHSLRSNHIGIDLHLAIVFHMWVLQNCLWISSIGSIYALSKKLDPYLSCFASWITFDALTKKIVYSLLGLFDVEFALFSWALIVIIKILRILLPSTRRLLFYLKVLFDLLAHLLLLVMLKRFNFIIIRTKLRFLMLVLLFIDASNQPFISRLGRHYLRWLCLLHVRQRLWNLRWLQLAHGAVCDGRVPRWQAGGFEGLFEDAVVLLGLF